MTRLDYDNKISRLIYSFGESRNCLDCFKDVVHHFRDHQQRTLAHILHDMRLFLGYNFDKETKVYPGLKINEINTLFDLFLIQLKIALDQISHLASMFYINLGSGLRNEDKFYSIGKLRRDLQNLTDITINKGFLDILDKHWVWIYDVQDFRDKLVHRFYYSYVDYIGWANESRIFLQGHEPICVNSLMSFVSITYYCYCRFVDDFATYFNNYFLNHLENYTARNNNFQQRSDSNFWNTLDFFEHEGAIRLTRITINNTQINPNIACKELEDLVAGICPPKCGCRPSIIANNNNNTSMVFTASCKHKKLLPISYDAQNIFLSDYIKDYNKNYNDYNYLKTNAIVRVKKKRAQY